MLASFRRSRRDGSVDSLDSTSRERGTDPIQHRSTADLDKRFLGSDAARTQARLQGVPDLRLVVVPRRQGGETDEDQRRKAEAALDLVVTNLVEDTR